MWRYRFKTKQYKEDSFHQMFVTLQMPYWISAEYKEEGYAIVTCYLPQQLSLKSLVGDATKIEAIQCDSIEYSKRFPKPEWIEG